MDKHEPVTLWKHAQINRHTSTDSHNTPLDSLRCPQNDMVYWGEDQNLELVRCIERGDIDPHNTDGDYLFGKSVQLFKGFEGDGTTRSRANVIARLRKKLRNYCFDGTLPGRRKRAAGELFTSHSLFLPALSIPILTSPLAHVSDELDISGEDDDDNSDDDNSYYGLEEEDTKISGLSRRKEGRKEEAPRQQARSNCCHHHRP